MQPKRRWSTARLAALVIFVTATLGAQSTDRENHVPTAERLRDCLLQRGVFEGPGEINTERSTPSASTPDDRIRWHAFYLIYTDDVLSRYAPGGASGARFDLFQFAGFSGAQPFGYPIHILVSDRHTTLIGVVDNIDDKRIAEIRAREVPGIAGVDNALVVDQQRSASR